MNCLKCGREIVAEQVFCEVCLADMEKYPVKPGTLVQLPRRQTDAVGKKSHVRRKAPPAPEEQVKHLRKAVRGLVGLVLVLLVLLGVLGYFTVIHLQEENKLRPGQNYSAVSENSAPSEAG